MDRQRRIALSGAPVTLGQSFKPGSPIRIDLELGFGEKVEGHRKILVVWGHASAPPCPPIYELTASQLERGFEFVHMLSPRLGELFPGLRHLQQLLTMMWRSGLRHVPALSGVLKVFLELFQ